MTFCELTCMPDVRRYRYQKEDVGALGMRGRLACGKTVSVFAKALTVLAKTLTVFSQRRLFGRSFDAVLCIYNNYVRVRARPARVKTKFTFTVTSALFKGVSALFARFFPSPNLHTA